MQNLYNSVFSIGHNTLVDPDLELRGGPSFVLLALLVFLPSFISSYLPKIRGGGGGGGVLQPQAPLDSTRE